MRPGCPQLPPGDLWVFGYGSLMWNPGFEYQRAAPALLRGYHRAFCVYSVLYRGTPEQPGLVLGLDRGGACRGIAFRIGAAAVSAVIEQLWAREMPGNVYRARVLRVEVEREKVPALAFVADPAHESYAGRLSLEEVAARIVDRGGVRGPNIDYLANTLRYLDELGIRERRLHRVLQAVHDMACRAPAGAGAVPPARGKRTGKP